MESPKYDLALGEITNAECSPFVPNWALLRKKLSAPLLELCYFSHGFDHFQLSNWEPLPSGFDLLASNEYYKEWRTATNFLLWKSACTIEIAENHYEDESGALVGVGGDLVDYAGCATPLVNIDNFIEWAGSIGLELPEGFTRDRVIVPTTDTDAKTIEEADRIIAGLVEFIGSKDVKKLNQKGLKAKLIERNDRIKERHMTHAFARANKLVKSEK